MKVSEPISLYHTPELQALKSRLIAFVNDASDEDKLEQCLAILQEKKQPCAYSDEEFAEELHLSEASGYVSHEEALAEFSKWGFGR